jgi:cytosine/uracil/thiamine/allantoin permease
MRRFNHYWLARPGWQFAAFMAAAAAAVELIVLVVPAVRFSHALGTSIGVGLSVLIGCLIGRRLYDRRRREFR